MSDIEVVYNDGMFGIVSPLELEQLIRTDSIVKFLRGDAWIYPGVDPTRKTASRPVFEDKRTPDLNP